MSQLKNRRQAARRKARAALAAESHYYVHFNTTSTLRNPIGKVSPLGRVIGVGFGSATVSRDGALFVDGENPKRRSLTNREGWVTLRKVEKWIKRHGAGRSKWIASIRAPLWDATWERQRPGKWVCVEAGEGFA